MNLRKPSDRGLRRPERWLARAAVLVSLGLLGSGTPMAQTPKGGGDAAVLQTLRKAQGMLRQLSQEKADLEARTVEQEERIKRLEARVRELEPLQQELKQARTGLEAARAGNAALQSQILSGTTRLQAVTDQQQRTAAELARYQRDNRLLVNAVTERTRWIEACGAKNKSLVRANREIVEKLGNRGFWDRLKDGEPVTGIGGVAVENRVQEFHFKLDELEVTPWREESPPRAGTQAADPEAAAAGDQAGDAEGAPTLTAD